MYHQTSGHRREECIREDKTFVYIGEGSIREGRMYQRENGCIREEIGMY